MNRKTGEKIVVTTLAAAGMGAAVLAMAPQAMAQKAKVAPKAAASGPTTFRDCPTCPEMVRLPGGSFEMGSPPTEEKRGADEGPIRTVTVKPFAVGKFEITFDEWDACVIDGGCGKPPGGISPTTALLTPGALPPGVDPQLVISLVQQSGGDAQQLGLLAGERGIPRAVITQIQALVGGAAAPAAGGPQRAGAAGGAGAAQGGRGGANSPIPADPGGDNGFGRGKQPVINVSWTDAQAYIAWLNKKTGKNYRLLTEAEWEYAGRAGAKTTFFWGDKPEAGREFANFEGTEGKDTFGSRPAPVGSLNPNPWGVYDLTGNVSEWVQDCYKKDYAGAPVDGAAFQQPNCTLRVVRGGSWSSSEELQRAANRDWVGDNYRSAMTGFRVARGL